MTEQHTPGPWVADFGETTSVRLSDGSRVATVNHLRLHGRVAASEAAANARLIEAAPEMLEALEGYISDCTNDECERCIKARAAIAKVRGAQ